MASVTYVIATAALSLLALSATSPAISLELAEAGEQPHQLQKRGLVAPNPFLYPPAVNPPNTNPVINGHPLTYFHPLNPNFLDTVAPLDFPKPFWGPGSGPGRRENGGGKGRRKSDLPRNERGRGEERRRPEEPGNGGCSCTDSFCPSCLGNNEEPLPYIPPPVAEPTWD